MTPGAGRKKKNNIGQQCNIEMMERLTGIKDGRMGGRGEKGKAEVRKEKDGRIKDLHS